MPTPDYQWRDRIDPRKFDGKWEEGFKHYRSEYERLSNLIVESAGRIPRDELDAMRSDRNHAAARTVGFSLYLIPHPLP